MTEIIQKPVFHPTTEEGRYKGVQSHEVVHLPIFNPTSVQQYTGVTSGEVPLAQPVFNPTTDDNRYPGVERHRSK